MGIKIPRIETKAFAFRPNKICRVQFQILPWPTECSVSLQSTSTSEFPRCRFLPGTQLNSLPLGASSQPSLAVAANLLPHAFIFGQLDCCWSVDFILLLPANLSKLPSCMPYDAQLAGLLRNDLEKFLNFRDWSEAWAVYAAVLSKIYPERVSDLLAYYLLIPGCNWMGYDCLFREKAVSDKSSLPWGLAGPSLWVTRMVYIKVPDNSAYSGVTCSCFNKGSCQFRDKCKFVHNAHCARFSAMESMPVVIYQGLQRSILSLKPGKENFL